MGGKRREECGNTDTDIMIKPVAYIRLPQEDKYRYFFLHVPFRNTVGDMIFIETT